LLDIALSFPHEWATPDVVVEEELGELGDAILARGVTALRADEQLQQEWEELRSAYRLPSDADLYGLVHARHLGTRLVTGDRDLRESAEAEGVEVSGVLWLLDELVDTELVTGPNAARGLQAMLDQHARLPRDECERRLRKWVRLRSS